MSPAGQTIARGDRIRFALVARYANGSVRNLTDRAVWRSSSPRVASVQGKGLVVGRARGGAVIRATFDRRTVTTRVRVGARSMGPLRVSPRNPRYFQDGAGRVVYLAGAHTWADLIDSGTSSPPQRFAAARFLDTLQTQGLNLVRLWAWEQARWTAETETDYRFSPLVYRRTGPGRGADGELRFDLTRFDPAYFARLRGRVIAARERGIYAIVMLFNGWSIEAKGPALNNPWRGHPFNGENNVNGVNGDVNGDGGGGETHTLAIPAVTRLQEAYARRVVEAVGDQPNVLFEISNESSAGSIDWQNHMVRVIRDLERTRRLQHPIGMSAEFPGGDNADLRNSAASWISPSGSITDPEEADGGKVVLLDTDHVCGVCGDAAWPWKSFTRGDNPLLMDIWDGRATGLGARDGDPADPRWEQIRRALGATRTVAARLDLARTLPRSDLASSGYCLADASPRGRYLVFVPGGGPVTVDVSATPGRLRVAWIRPESGAVQAGGMVDGGGRRTLTAPFGGDAVLSLRS